MMCVNGLLCFFLIIVLVLCVLFSSEVCSRLIVGLWLTNGWLGVCWSVCLGTVFRMFLLIVSDVVCVCSFSVLLVTLLCMVVR